MTHIPAKFTIHTGNGMTMTFEESPGVKVARPISLDYLNKLINRGALCVGNNADATELYYEVMR